MSWHWIKRFFTVGLLLLAIGGALLSQLLVSPTCPEWLQNIAGEILVVCRDSSTQWMVVFCLASYFGAFLVLEYRLTENSHWWRIGNTNLWLAALVLLVILRYAFAFDTASISTQVPIFLAGIVFGKSISYWAQWRRCEIERRVVWFIALLVCLLVLIVLWQPNMTEGFRYHGVPRWSGISDNPNIYGLLMGTGFVLAIGIGVQEWHMPDGLWKILRVIPCILGAILMSIGLLHSYSRGAWLGTVFGLAYLLTKSEIRSQKSKFKSSSRVFCSSYISWFKKNWLPLSVILASVFILSFWDFRQTEWHPARRALSAINPVDFSWRNRVAAWEGALQIAAEHPWLGTGWNWPEPLYEYYYMSPKLNESVAIEMNDYLMLGATLGIPALFCFGMYIFLSLTRPGIRVSPLDSSSPIPSKYGSPNDNCGKLPKLLGKVECATFSQMNWLQATCHAGAIVLLVGFWFDGGLFKLPTTVIFWILLELGLVALHKGEVKQTNEVL